ncbi:hypothetical protein SAMN04487906_3308 [Zhouia amylolytica]|uniref:Uncharacterized protein n=1 Tax=Zhouia amylolytica TaxID=376730 RepID=A0A1I6VRJ9_9FLAO|nr:hypothetical protein [Zhouia amylolytica]MCQ0112499.1 hypothetical protein [Zhouia amylolytica]SFT16360.1 hypothetical protein SAMN04487906_3308 [Zhouia amylolytica]
MILVFKHIFPKPYVGLTLWPVIFVKEDVLKQDQVLINHEKIHLRQQLELLIIPFYLIYLTEWLIGIVKYGNAYTAYKNISFEREAYKNEQNTGYLKSRSPWSFVYYYGISNKV